MHKGTKIENGKSPFEIKWGIGAKEFAEQEGVTTEAIYMRVRNYGSIFQRKAKPTKLEKKYGKCTMELARELGVDPITVLMREYHHGDLYTTKPKAGWTYNRDKHKIPARHYRDAFWLHESHPDYEQARKGEYNA